MTAESDSHALELADDLEALLSERLTAAEFEAKYRAKYEGGVVAHSVLDLIAGVWHYLADADIRARDAEYREMQELEMQRLIRHLRAGRLAEAQRITFLGPTCG
jgi:hypothetical protein